MSLAEKLKSDKFIVTCEIGPPKGINVDKILKEADSFKERVDAVNVTDLQSSVMRLGSLVMCYLLRTWGHEPILQLTTRDRNRLALQSDILSAAVLGIENILALTGDHPLRGDHPEAKPVYDLDSVQLLEVIKLLNSGVDMAGNKLDGKPKILPGAAVNPGIDPIEPEIIKMEKKVKSGAKFFQTQAVFDIDKFTLFLKKVKHIDVPILASVILLKSPAMAHYMNDNVAGVNVPNTLIKDIESVDKKDRVKKAVEIASGLINGLKTLCRGVHIMPIGWESKVPLLLDAAGL
ncbi:MAG: methylenetetrahydrofolate reductase [Candidatus Omnitrophota bacterium]|nr:MAG: methylenetetrahydrofolate reductase [Candidatus Omnitrophota bacterium]